MPAHCCVPMCKRKGGHKFPLDPLQRQRWIQAVKRGEPDWTPSKWSTVCRAHFDSSNYISETREKNQMVNNILKPCAIPHIFSWNRKSLAGSSRRERALCKRQKLEEMETLECLTACANVGNEIETESIEEDRSYIEVSSESSTREVGTQAEMRMCFCARKYMFDSQKFQYYTGLENYEAFVCLFHSFGPVVDELNYFYGTKPSLCTEDQFFLTLVKLRLARSNFELSDMFEICEKDLMNIFVTWVNFMYFHFSEIDWWPSKDLTKCYSPADFKSKFPTTRVIIDGTEIPIQRPKQPIIQQGTFSTYKNRNTIKVLVGVTPGGLVSYVSDAYGGATSDRQICERSNLMTLCESGDSIMADKGFNVQDLFIPTNVEVNIPEFFKKKNRMSGSSVVKDRKIASKRVHVERIIGLAKTFKILTKPLNNTESNISDAIISVCFYLCNFRTSIVPNNA